MSEEEKKVEAKKPIEVKSLVDADQMRKDVSINPSDLSNAMMEQASLRLHYGIQAARAQKQVDDLKMLLEIKTSQVAKAMRDAPLEEGKKKPSEAQLDKDVALHSDVIRISRALNEAKMILALAKAGDTSFEDRKDMLIQMGARDRAELQGELRMAAISASDKAVLDRATKLGGAA